MIISPDGVSYGRQVSVEDKLAELLKDDPALMSKYEVAKQVRNVERSRPRGSDSWTVPRSFSAKSEATISDSVTRSFQQGSDRVTGRISDKIESQNENVRVMLLELERIKEEERLEKERLEREERERLEKDRLEKERLEKERLEKEKLEKEKLEQERLEKEKLEKQKIEKQRLEMEEKQRLEKEKEKQQLEAEKKKNSGDFAAIETKFLSYKEIARNVENDIVAKLQSPENASLKTGVNQVKRKINPKFGQLTNSRQQLTRITNEINQLISETKVQPLAYEWLLDFTAKRIVAQAQAEVTVSPHTALPLATLSVNLIIQFPELKKMLLTRLIEACPLILGYSCAIDTEEGRERMGWKRDSSDKWEDETKYNERLGGVCTVFAVMTRLSVSGKHPLPISNSWKFLARMVNTPPHLLGDVHFICVANWWEGAAREFLASYGVQARKLLGLVCSEWTLSVADRRLSGAARLRLLGEDWHKDGGIAGFKDMVM